MSRETITRNGPRYKVITKPNNCPGSWRERWSSILIDNEDGDWLGVQRSATRMGALRIAKKMLNDPDFYDERYMSEWTEG